MRMTRHRTIAWTVLLALLLVPLVATGAEPPRNVIVMIGDGMGLQQVKAASLYATGKKGGLAFEKYYRGLLTTHSLNSHLAKYNYATDSAAAATALATGHKTNNEVVGRDAAGADVETILEHLAKQGKWTGLVVTLSMTHATPAGFAAHARKRTDYKKIASDYFTVSRPNILFGATRKDGSGVTPLKARQAGYTVVTTRDEMSAYAADAKLASTAAAAKAPYVSGQFGNDLLPWEYDGPVTVKHRLRYTKKPGVDYKTVPHLSEMTQVALDLLADGPKGFFLMVEGSTIDWACHDNFIERAVHETVEFAKAFEVVMKWADRREDTLVVVAADHETGGMWVVKGRGKGKMPEVLWGTRNHSGITVPTYAWGPGAESLETTLDETDLWAVIMGTATPVAVPVAVPDDMDDESAAGPD